MNGPESLLNEIDRQKIKLAIQLHTPIEITTYTLPRNMELYIYQVLTQFLEECHQEHMIEYLKFCLGELLTNSKKANTKRVYFTEKHLDINDDMDYQDGMISYKSETLGNINHYLEEQKKAGLYIKFSIQLRDDSIIVEIKNNSLLTKAEKKRIQEKLRTAQKYNNVNEVMGKIIDQTEGAGLGIIIIILMLEKIGLSKENYKVFCTETDTVTRMELPLNTQVRTDVEKLSDYFLATQNLVPVLEEKLNKLNELLNSPDANEVSIKELIFTDVTLSTLLLKKASQINGECCQLSQAFNLVGKDNLKELYSKDNSQLRTINATEIQRDFWQHAYKTAFYAYNLAKNFSVEGHDPEQIYTYALLHDIECILLDVISSEQKQSIEDFAKQNNIPQGTVDLFYNNAAHSKGGCIIAKKWGLADSIANVILFHNNPDGAPEEIKKLVDMVYFADLIQHYNEGQVEFYQFNETVLNDYNIDSENKLRYIINQIQGVITA